MDVQHGTGAVCDMNDTIERIDMGAVTFDCHPRFDERTHKVLTALSQATGEPISKIAGDWLQARAEVEAHKAKKIVACLLTCEGRGGTRGDSP